MNIDERIQALTMNLELSWREIEAMREHAREQDSRIERLVTVVESLADIAQSTNAA